MTMRSTTAPTARYSTGRPWSVARKAIVSLSAEIAQLNAETREVKRRIREATVR